MKNLVRIAAVFFCLTMLLMSPSGAAALDCTSDMLQQTAMCTRPVGGTNGCEIWVLGYDYLAQGYKLTESNHQDSEFNVKISKPGGESCWLSKTQDFGDSGWRFSGTSIMNQGKKLRVNTHTDSPSGPPQEPTPQPIQ